MASRPLATSRNVLERVAADALARGAGLNLGFAGLNVVVGMLGAVLAARHLGPGGVGMVALGFLIIEFLSVVDNLPTAAFIREYSRSPDSRKVATVFVVKGSIGLSLSLAVAAASPLLARALDVPLVVPLAFAFIPMASIVDSVAIMSHEARRDMVRRNLPGSAENVARLALYALVAFGPHLGWTPVAAISIATLAGSFLGTLVGAALLPKFRLREFDPRLALEFVRFGSRVALTGAMQKVVFWFDILLIDRIFGHGTQGLYKTAYTLMSYLPLAAGAVAIVLYPTIAALREEAARADVERLLARGFYYGLALAVPIALVFLAVPEALLTALFGAEFAPAAPMLRALAVAGVLAVLVMPFEAFFPALNRPDLTLRIAVVEVVVNTGLNLVLIPRYGWPGAAVASAAAFGSGLAVAAYQLRKLGYRFPTPSRLRGG